ncbi:tripartite tricarboxylate transporter TctB family protein [Paraburkholderia xenovorans]|uniref:tripartite tricarboxylate transporter TctB family protein n=1 Tax=Paraburkholderia xenovorans TaxID=36873 RepID=UPI00155939A9|nr:tripartite tricarboxylate transporter TctB family protein [Paraburkholderia xenovorans]NPT36465.1 tripartite tricarboxylate transporter TctB family protein [Paraburkholderia xenovorans]
MSNGRERRFVTEYTRDYYGGALMLLVGLAAAFQGSRYGIGSMTHMKAGFYPVVLGVILAILGVIIAGSATRVPSGDTEDEAQPSEWRGWICIVSSTLAFLLLGKFGGLLPASFAIVFISALGDRDNSVRAALIVATAISAVSVVLFWWALQLQFPLFSWG